MISSQAPKSPVRMPVTPKNSLSPQRVTTSSSSHTALTSMYMNINSSQAKKDILMSHPVSSALSPKTPMEVQISHHVGVEVGLVGVRLVAERREKPEYIGDI